MDHLLDEIRRRLDSLQVPDTTVDGEELKDDIANLMADMNTMQLTIVKEVVEVLKKGLSVTPRLKYSKPLERGIETTGESTEEQTMESVIGCLLKDDYRIQGLITDIIKWSKYPDDLKSYSVKDELNHMESEDLEPLLMASVVVRFITERFSGKPGYEDLHAFFSWLQSNQFAIKRQVKEEVTKAEKGKKGWFSSDERKPYIKGIESQKLNQEQFRIARRLVELGKKSTVEHRDSYHHREVPIEHDKHQYVQKQNFHDTDTFRQNVSQTTGNFLDSLNSKTLQKESSTFDSPLPLAPRTHLQSDNLRIEEENRRLAMRKEDQERFEKEVGMKRRENSQKEELMREEKARNDEKADREFRETVEKQEKEIQENYKKFQQEIEDYERETQRLREERKRKWQEFEASFYACVLIEQQFKRKEKEWGSWLQSLSDSISNVKTRYNLFQKIVGTISKDGEHYHSLIRQELNALHKTTLSAYDLLFEACNKVKNLGGQFPDGVFLAILHKRLSDVSNKLCNALENVDHCLNSQSVNLSYSFSDLRPNDIPTTGQLRRDSQESPYSTFGSDPRVYMTSSSVVIEEMKDDSGRVETYF